MKIVTARPIDNDSFAPYGQLLDVPAGPGRYDFQAELFNGRADARPNLLLASAEASALPLEIERMERHPQSSQAFFPLEAARYIVMVCPDAADGGPDMARLDAFIVGATQGINYNPGIWHHPLTALDGAAKFAALVWENGTEADTEWYSLAPDQRRRIES
ncbi:MAG: ureidoglycolate lyase [Alphaproteobacteria bacterium]|jgi:ureidoglycolate lyase|nr:ureidoglycolate lyase [Alphaproteobacteria bacterium]MDP6817896.1 ureidoglycolate lyase [Alphaproteobacteria bacterium]